MRNGENNQVNSRQLFRIMIKHSFCVLLSSGPNAFNVPHSLALVPESNLVCVADRENGRIQCLSTIDGTLKKMIKHPEFKTYIYAIAYKGIKLIKLNYSPIFKAKFIFISFLDGYMYAVNGPTSSHGSESRAQGFIIDLKGSGEIVSVFGSKASTHLGTPHALALGSNGSFLYIAEISPYRVVKLSRGINWRIFQSLQGHLNFIFSSFF